MNDATGPNTLLHESDPDSVSPAPKITAGDPLPHESPQTTHFSVVDADGTLWNARWGEGRVNAYSPDGRLVRSVPVPAVQTSCPAFFGPRADRLAVTSAWAGMDERQRAADPHAGKTFRIDLPVNGRFEPRVLI